MKKFLFLIGLAFVPTTSYAEQPFVMFDSSGNVIEPPPCPSIQCPSGTFMGDDGKCYNCDEKNDIKIDCLGSDILEICPNRITWGRFARLCPQNSCQEGTFMGDDGKCYNCDEDKHVSVHCIGKSAISELCPNRGTYDCIGRLRSYRCPSGTKNKDGQCCPEGESVLCVQEPLCMP